MANWFCSVFIVVCVVDVCPVSPRCRSELIDSAWVVILSGQKCIKKIQKKAAKTNKNQSGFRSGDSTTNQLIDLVNDSHRAFDSTKSLEVRAIFLDISKAFDKVWHDGLIFKMRQNDVSGRLLKLFQNYLNNR